MSIGGKPEALAGLGARAHDVRDKIHAAARPDPGITDVGAGQLEDDVQLQPDVAVKRQVAIRDETGRWSHELGANDVGHGGK